MQRAMNIWWHSQQKAEPLNERTSGVGVYLPRPLALYGEHAEGPECTAPAPAEVSGVWLPGYPSWRRDRCVGGVQSFLISSISRLYYRLSPTRIFLRIPVESGCFPKHSSVPTSSSSMTAAVGGGVSGGYPIVSLESQLSCIVKDIDRQRPPIQLAPCLWPSWFAWGTCLWYMDHLMMLPSWELGFWVDIPPPC